MTSLPSSYTLILFVHILGATVLLGNSLSAPLTRTAIRSSTTVAELRGWLGFAGRMARPNPIAALVVLASGLYLGSQGWWRASWFLAALVAFVGNSVLAASVIKPLGMRIGRLLVGLDAAPVPAEANVLRNSRRWETVTDLMLANDVSVLYLMLRKPELGESILVLLIVNAAVAIVRVARRSASSEAAPHTGSATNIGGVQA
jgi:hypothetical protein